MTRPVSIFLSSLIILGMIQLGCQVYAQSPKTITSSLGTKRVLIPKGIFTMGSLIEEEGAVYDEEQHQVTISKDYYLGVTEVTQGQYEKVMLVVESEQVVPATPLIVKRAEMADGPR